MDKINNFSRDQKFRNRQMQPFYRPFGCVEPIFHNAVIIKHKNSEIMILLCKPRVRVCIHLELKNVHTLEMLIRRAYVHL